MWASLMKAAELELRLVLRLVLETKTHTLLWVSSLVSQCQVVR